MSIEEMLVCLAIATLLLKPNEMMSVLDLVKNLRSNIEKHVINQASRFVKFCSSINESEEGGLGKEKGQNSKKKSSKKKGGKKSTQSLVKDLESAADEVQKLTSLKE